MELLDYLAELLGCTYLSDLHYVVLQPKQAHAILSIPDERFPLESYYAALDYIADRHSPFPDFTAAKQGLVDALQQRRL